jgi:hypothetical protein
MGRRPFEFSSLICALAALAIGFASSPAAVQAATVTFSGTVSYQGAYSGDTLYVAVLDTTQGQDVSFVSVHAYPVGSPPLSQPYSLDFDNSTTPATLLVAALLDVDGGGVDTVSGADVVGWYAGTATPTGVSSSSSHSGLDFALPRAEIQGTLTMAAGQSNAYLNVTVDPLCGFEGFNRPQLELNASGAYTMVGIYPGTYCATAYGFFSVPPFFAQVCYGDPTCASPTLITLTATEVKTGVDFDFTSTVPVKESTWGRIKSRYR